MFDHPLSYRIEHRQPDTVPTLMASVDGMVEALVECPAHS